MKPVDHKKLRTKVRNKRLALSPLQQQLAASRIHKKIIVDPVFKQARHIAFYNAIQGEVNLQRLLKHALTQGKNCYLPSVIAKQKELHFYQIHSLKQLRKGSFNILQAPHQNRIHARQLDLVLMPLLGFDDTGHRLGMGGGYYDFTFRHLAKQNFRKTYLLGVAHRCQKVDTIKSNVWDIKPRKIIAV